MAGPNLSKLLTMKYGALDNPNRKKDVEREKRKKIRGYARGTLSLPAGYGQAPAPKGRKGRKPKAGPKLKAVKSRMTISMKDMGRMSL